MSRNLGTLLVSFWPRQGASPLPYRVVGLEDDALLVATDEVRPASRIRLPCAVPKQQAEAIPAGGDVFEVKLALMPGSPAIPRGDLEVRAPWSAEELRDARPQAFRCATCDAILADTSAITRYNALPSEHWAELLDAWMCHQDQTLSEDLIAKGQGIKPRDDEGLVGTTYLLLPPHVIRNTQKRAEAQVSVSSPPAFPLLPSFPPDLQERPAPRSASVGAGAAPRAGTASATGTNSGTLG